MTSPAFHTSTFGPSNFNALQRVLWGSLLISVAVLSFLPIAILGPAIGWPASLRSPAAQQLAAIASAPTAVALGCTVYLLYSVLILPVMVLLAWQCSGSMGRPNLATLVSGLWHGQRTAAVCAVAAHAGYPYSSANSSSGHGTGSLDARL